MKSQKEQYLLDKFHIFSSIPIGKYIWNGKNKLTISTDNPNHPIIFVYNNDKNWSISRI